MSRKRTREFVYRERPSIDCFFSKIAVEQATEKANQVLMEAVDEVNGMLQPFGYFFIHNTDPRRLGLTQGKPKSPEENGQKGKLKNVFILFSL